MKKQVIVCLYDPRWPAAFEKIRKEIEAAAGDCIIGIEHVGSTSVEGLAAKPIIDLDVIIRDYSVFRELLTRLSQIGYIHEGNLGIADREAFCYEGKPHLQKHHLYVCPASSEELHRHLTFRDYLRTHPDAAAQYGRVKMEAAAAYPDDIEGYMQYKSACIEKLYEACGLN